MLRKKLFIIVFAVALVAIAGLANAAPAPAPSCVVKSIYANGNYIGEPLFLGNSPGQYGYSYVFVPDGTYTVSGILTNKDPDNGYTFYVDVASSIDGNDENIWVPAGGSVDFSLTLNANSYDDITHFMYGYYMGDGWTLDLSGVDHTKPAEQSHTYDEGSMSNSVAIYKDGGLVYAGLPSPSPTPNSTDSGVKQTEFGYWITYPPLGPEKWSTNPPRYFNSGKPGPSFAGTWDTDWGTMVITVNGNAASGNYDYQGGLITGTTSGNNLAGTWSEDPTHLPPDDAGDILFTLSADGNSFYGHWRYGHSSDPNAAWDGSWSGTRVS